MKPYLISIAVGVLVGLIYSALNVRSPAPPAIALLGLLGMLLGEKALPIAKRLVHRELVLTYLQAECAEHVLGPQVAKSQSEKA